MKESNAVSMVIADAHAMIREGLAAILAARLDLQVIAECPDGASALETIEKLQPDFAIIDLDIPIIPGLDLVRHLRAGGSKTRLIVLSAKRDDSLAALTLLAGAEAYVLKHGPTQQLVDAINRVTSGGIYITPLMYGGGSFAVNSTISEDPLARLSDREHEVFEHLVNGVRPKEIAWLLNISPKTVDTYRANLMRKLKVRDLVGLVRFAIAKNLTSVPLQ